MISRAAMKREALSAMAGGLEDTACNLRLASLGPEAKQRDVNKLRAYLLSEAGKLRAKFIGIEDAEKNKKLKRLLGEENEGAEMPAQGVQGET